MRPPLTITSSETTASLLSLLTGPDGALDAATLEKLPVALACSLALHLARYDGDERARTLAAAIFDALRPLAGETVKLDDDLAKLATSLGHHTDAAAILEARLERSDALAAHQALAEAYLALGRIADARAIAARLTREVGDRLTPWLIAGAVALAEDDTHAAVAAYQRALGLYPNTTRALLGLADCRAREGDTAGANELVARVFAAYGDAPSAWVLDYALRIARRLGETAWADELAARRAALDAQEAEKLRFQLDLAIKGGPAASPAGRLARVSRRVGIARAAKPTDVIGNEPADDDTSPLPSDEPEEPASDDLLDALAEHFGYDSFLPGQATIISAVLRGEDVLALLPTGAGKSLCYQLPALLLPGDRKSVV